MGQFQEGIARAVDILVNAHESNLREKQHQAELAERKDQLAEQKRQFDENKKLQVEAADRMNQLQHAYLDMQGTTQKYNIMKQEQGMSEDYARTGIIPSGAQVGPATGQNVMYNPATGGLVPSVGTSNIPGRSSLTFPSGNVVQVPSPEEYAQKQADLARITNAPATEAKIREAQATGEIELNNRLKLLDASFPKELALAKVKNDWEVEREKMRQTGDNYRANLMNNTRLKALELSKGGLFTGMGGGSLTLDEDGNFSVSPGTGDTGQRVGNLMSKVASGQVTEEEIPKLLPNVKDRTEFSKMMLQNNITPVKGKLSDRLDDLQKVSAFLNPLYDAFSAVNNNPFAVQFGQMTDAGAKLKNANDIIDANRALFVRVLEGSNRYTHQQAEDIVKELHPQSGPEVFLPNVISNQNKKYEFFVKHQLQDAVDSVIGKFSPAQQKLIRSRIDLPDVRQAEFAPGGEHPQIGGTTAPTVGNEKKPTQQTSPDDRLTVYDKQKGRAGTQLRKFIDANPGRYTVMGTAGGQQ